MSGVRPVLIAGGGPVGVVTALALARAGLEVRLFEADNRVNEAPRAASTHPSTLEMLDGLGLINEVLQQGLKAPTFQFRERSSGELIAEFDHLAIRDDTPYPFVVQLEQHKLANIAIEQLFFFSSRRRHTRLVSDWSSDVCSSD